MDKLDKLVEGMEKAYTELKTKECAELYNEMIDVITRRKATVQTVLFTMKMIEFSLLKAKYQELVEGAIQIPVDGATIPKAKTEGLVEKTGA